MPTRKDELAKDIDHIRGELKELRDEIRVRLHLGAMDARDAFAGLEHQVDHIGRDISQATLRALVRARKQLKELKTAFDGHDAQSTNASPRG
jgi:hypothetical protein